MILYCFSSDFIRCYMICYRFHMILYGFCEIFMIINFTIITIIIIIILEVRPISPDATFFRRSFFSRISGKPRFFQMSKFLSCFSGPFSFEYMFFSTSVLSLYEPPDRPKIWGMPWNFGHALKSRGMPWSFGAWPANLRHAPKLWTLGHAPKFWGMPQKFGTCPKIMWVALTFLGFPWICYFVLVGFLVFLEFSSSRLAKRPKNIRKMF